MQKENTLFIGGESYGYWPRIEIVSRENIYGQLQCVELDALLSEEGEAFELWREAIPKGIRDAILSFSEGRAELLLLAQIWPERFMQLYERGPAWLYLASNYWLFDGRRQRPSEKEREDFFAYFYLNPIHRSLGRFGFDTRSKARNLAKLTFPYCVPHYIFSLSEVLSNKGASKRLSYLDSINGAVVDLAQSEEYICDPGLLRLASEKAWDMGENISVVLGQVRYWLDFDGRESGWVYKGQVRSWKTLRKIRTRLQLGCGHEDPFEVLAKDAEFPKPPLSTNEAKEQFGLVVEPLDSRQKLDEETRDMLNCSATYADVVPVVSDLYLYRILEPFRATLLLRKTMNQWKISQLYGYANMEVRESDRVLVEEWIGLGNASCTN